MHHNGPEGFDIMSSRIHRKHRQNRPSATTAAHNPALSIIDGARVDAELRTLIGGIFDAGDAGP